MNHITITQLMMIPTTNVSYSESIKTNYANYQSSSTTQNSDALINVLSGSMLLVEENEILEQNDSIQVIAI